MEGRRENSSLGNFGFLLDYGKDFLYELGQQAESCVYTNPRLCAVFIRQLMEAFFDLVMDELGIEDRTAAKRAERAGDQGIIYSTAETRQYSITAYVNSKKTLRDYQTVFPPYPGDSEDRIPVPSGKDDDQKGDEHVWNAIRKLGNIGSHGVLLPENRAWLEEKYLLRALRELCERIGRYCFIRKGSAFQPVKFSEDQIGYGSRQLLFPSSGAELEARAGSRILPKSWEQVCDVVVPLVSQETGYDNAVAGYALVRRFQKSKIFENYLQQSQRAYLVIENNGGIAGLPDYSVLADLRASESGYYVVSYRFHTKPYELCTDTLSKVNWYRDRKTLLGLMVQLTRPLEEMCRLNIYHRTFSHRCVRLEQRSNGTVAANIIGLESCKLNEGLTIISQVKESRKQEAYPGEKGDLPQYDYGNGHWQEDYTAEEYRRTVLARLSGVCLNLLCPWHFDNWAECDRPATADEILSPENEYLWSYIESSDIDETLLKELTGIFSQSLEGRLDFVGLLEELKRLGAE